MSEWTAAHQALFEELEAVDPVTSAGQRALAEREAVDAAALAARERREAKAAMEQAESNLRAHYGALKSRAQRQQQRRQADPWGWSRSGLFDRRR